MKEDRAVGRIRGYTSPLELDVNCRADPSLSATVQMCQDPSTLPRLNENVAFLGREGWTPDKRRVRQQRPERAVREVMDIERVVPPRVGVRNAAVLGDGWGNVWPRTVVS